MGKAKAKAWSIINLRKRLLNECLKNSFQLKQEWLSC